MRQVLVYVFFFFIHLFLLWIFTREISYLSTLVCVVGTPVLFDLAESTSERKRFRIGVALLYCISAAFCLLDWNVWWINWPYPILIVIAASYMILHFGFNL